jgi:adenylylsulfate kinase
MSGQVIWITGLSGAGKTTLAEELNLRLTKNNLSSIVLDGDILRKIFQVGSGKGQYYSRDARIDLGLKYGLLCKTLSNQGFLVIIATISMFDEVYIWNRKNIENYFEIYLKVPLSELYSRDNKKIYKRYEDGDLNNVAGLDLLVDEPSLSDVTYDFNLQPVLWESPKNLVDSLMEDLNERLSLFQGNFN